MNRNLSLWIEPLYWRLWPIWEVGYQSRSIHLGSLTIKWSVVE